MIKSTRLFLMVMALLLSWVAIYSCGYKTGHRMALQDMPAHHAWADTVLAQYCTPLKRNQRR